MCDIIFEKMKGHGGTERVFMQIQQSEGFLNKVLWEISRNSQENIARKTRL